MPLPRHQWFCGDSLEALWLIDAHPADIKPELHSGMLLEFATEIIGMATQLSASSRMLNWAARLAWIKRTVSFTRRAFAHHCSGGRHQAPAI